MTFEDLSKQLNTSVQSLQNLVQVLTAAFSEMEGGGSSAEYSAEERVVGTWIDGKPVYEKTFIFSSILKLTSNTWNNSEIVIADYNFKKLVGVTAYASDNGIFGFLAVAIDAGNYVRFLSSRPSDQYLTGVTLRYTKTTD